MPNLEMQIHLATADDAQALSRFSARLFPLGCPANTRPEDLADYIDRELTPEKFLSLLADEQIAILIVKIANSLAGFALIARGAFAPDAQSLGEVELRKFYVDPLYHGQGIANALMQSVLQSVQDAGALWLSVFSGNPRAIAFYQRWGFRVTGSRIFLVGTDEQKDYLMQRKAAQSAKENS
ncbi:MAG TPA: GNAT family N-acetyltransferase [Terracidiphilus sp.]|nr:GNAT family N-acetyltransferase [Terracidiphilus sp.]